MISQSPFSRKAWAATAAVFLLNFLLTFAEPVWALTLTATPTTCTSVTGSGRSWSRASRAVSNNSSYATASVDGTTTNYLQCTGYGFAIPTGATITGITVTIERKSSSTSNGGSQDAAMRLVKAGVIGTTDRSTATIYPTTSNVTEAHGGSTDLWGTTWTPADINATNFGAAFKATKPSSAGWSQTISVDVIQISVDYTLDTTPPTVVSITRANYTPTGATSVSWTVTFSESVTGVVAGEFGLIQAGGVSGATISSVTGSGTTWTVTANTGSGSGTLGLNLVDHDAIIDASGNKLGGTGTGNGNKTGEVYSIDKGNPTLISLVRANSNPTFASSVAWTATFSETVTGVDTGDFALATGSGLSGTSITSISGSGATYTITANTGSGSGTLGLNLVDNGTIKDTTGNFLLAGGVGGSQTGEVYTIDKSWPVVTSITRDFPNPTTAGVVTWSVLFSKSVTGVNASDFSLVASGLSGTYLVSVSGSGTTYTVTVNTGIGAGTLGLNLVDDDSIVDSLSLKLGSTGAGNGNFTGEVYTVSSTLPPLGYHMDENLWNGTTGEVTDITGSFPGTAKNSAGTLSTSPAISGDPGTCRYGVFDNGSTIRSGYIELDADFPKFDADFTITAWIKTTDNTKQGQWIFADDATGIGYAIVLGEAGTGALRFSSDGASTKNLDSSNNVITNNAWYFVAAVADFSASPSIVRKLYVFNASGSLLSGFPLSLTSTGWTTDTGVTTIGGISTASSGADHFRGYLDEVMIYDKVLTQSAITVLATQKHACTTSGIDHILIEHDGNGSTCAADSITLKACATADCSMLYLGGGITGTLQPFGTAFTIGTSGSVSVSVSPASGGTNTLSVTSVSPAPDNAADCLNTVTSAASCSFPVSACPGGANFDCLETAITPYATGTSRLYTKLAGTGFSFDVVALNSTGAVETDYVGTGGTAKTVTVQLVDASSNVLGTQTATFSAGNTTGRTTAPSFTISSASASVGCKVTDSVAGKVGNSADRFAIRPTVFTVTSTNATNTSSSGSPTFKAGSNSFNLTATAVAGYNGTPAIDNTKLVGTTNAGTISGSFSAANNATGVAIGNAFTYSEVGNFGLQANAIYDASFTSVDSASDCTADFSIALVGGKYGCKIGSTAVAQTTGSSGFGRFIPDHFTLTGSPVVPAFSYMDQPFTANYAIEAQNSGGGKTSNYTGTFASGVVSFAAENANSGSDFVAGPTPRVTVSTGSWSNGTYSVSAANNAKFARGGTPISPDGPYDTLALGVKVADPDGPVLQSLDMNPATGVADTHCVPTGGTPDVTNCTHKTIGTTKIRFGQMVLFPGYGSELVDLAMPIQIQYWNGSAFSINALDPTEVITGTQVGFAGLIPAGLILTKIAPSGSTPLNISGGAGALKLNSSGAVGTAQVTIDLSSMPYLRGSLAGATGYTSDPSAPVVFALYKKSNKVIFSRERY